MPLLMVFTDGKVSPFKAWRKKLPLKILAEIIKARENGPNDGAYIRIAWRVALKCRATGGRKKRTKILRGQ